MPIRWLFPWNDGAVAPILTLPWLLCGFPTHLSRGRGAGHQFLGRPILLFSKSFLSPCYVQSGV